MHPLLKPFRGPLTTNPFEPALRAIPAIAYMALIYLASSVPGDEITISFDDRVAHFLEYFIFGVLLVFAASAYQRGTLPRAAGAILAFAALHAIADEFHQSFVPNRDSSVKDFVFDMLGTSAALFLLWRFVKTKEAR